MQRLHFLFAILALSFFGCSTTLTKDQYFHSLNVEWDGRPWEVEVADEVDRPSPGVVVDFGEQLDAIWEDQDFISASQVMVFIHGGLNTLRKNQENTEV